MPKGLSFATIFLGIVSSYVNAQDFRVETDVFVEKTPKPVARNLTLFADRVYDFLLNEIDPAKDPDEVTVFDVTNSRFLMLHVGKRVQSTVTTDELMAFVATVRAQPGEKDKAFFLDPQFEESFDADTKELMLKSHPLTYRVKGMEPKDKQIVNRYHDFANWFARLNTMMRPGPGNLPPFSRIKLNRSVADRGWIPEEIRRSVVVREGLIERKVEVKSKHIVNELLSSSDRKRIETAGEYLATFKKVSPAEYLQAAQPIAIR